VFVSCKCQWLPADLGSRKHPRFGFYTHPSDHSYVTNADADMIEKWAKFCHREQEGHKRAIMVGHQAKTLATAIAEGRGPHEASLGRDEKLPADADDAWRLEHEESSTPEGEKALLRLPEEAQVQVRLAKGISFEQAAVERCHRELRIVEHEKRLLQQMAPIAAKDLTRLHSGDYRAQVCALWMHEHSNATGSQPGS
jgi:hypothetical protein